MKKYYSLSMLAIAAMAAFSCNKEIKPQEELTPVSEPKVIVAYTDKDVLPDTKTSLSGVEIIWSETDAIKGLDYDGNVHTASNPTIEEQGKKATFTFQDLSIVDDIYTLAYPASAVTGIDGDYVYASIPSEQKATPNSFADGANLAIADGGVEVPVFKNVGGLLSIVIKNDNIASVKLTANESLTGAAKISTASGENYASATITGGSSEVILSGGLNNGDPYYAVVYPGTYTGLQIVITDNDGRTATYSNPNALVVGRNANLFIAELTVADSKWVSLTKGAEWTYTFESKVYEANGTKTLNGKDWALAGDGGFWDQYSADKGQQFGSSGAPYKSLTMTSNFGDKYGVSDVTVNASGASSIEATISVSVGGTALKCNNSETVSLSSTATDYTFSTASGKLLAGDIVISISQTSSKALYIKSIAVNPDIRQDVTLSFDTNSFELYLGSSDYNNFAGQIASSSPSVTGIKYSLSGDAIGTVDENTGVVSLDGSTTGTATITASFDGDDSYQPASANYTLSVKESISDYSTVGTSNVTLSTTGGTSASSAKVNDYDALKAGTVKIAGAVKIKVPANTTNLHLHAAGWNEENVTLSITGATANPNSLNLTADSGIRGSSTAYYLSEGSDIADYYFNITLSGINEETTLTFTATADYRFVIWGVNAVEDNRLDPEMTWSNESATASITNSGVTFIAPTLNLGYASSVTYNSTEPSVATVESDGTVNILAAGTTKIQAIFAGDATYKPSTKEYTLNVTDERTYAITVTQPAEGGTIAVSPNGPQKASTEITLTADSDEGYELDSWSVYKTGDESTKVTVNGNSFEMPAYPVTITASFTIKTTEKTLQTLYLESFGSSSSNTALSSYAGYSATTSMFATSGDVKSHYSGSGSVGKNNLSATNLSSGYTGASGLSGCYHNGTANTEATIIQITGINIKDSEDISVSFGALGGSSSHKINVYYTIDDGAETALITDGSITNTGWTRLSESISGTGNTLTLIFKHTPTKGWTIRMDDITVEGKR